MLSLAFAGSLVSLSQAYAAPFSVSYSGRLTQSTGAPVDGPVDISVKFWNASVSGNTLTAPIEFTAVDLNSGVFSLPLELSADQVQQIFGDGVSPVFIEITAAGKTYPRQQYSFVPYALRIPVDGKTLAFDSNGNLGLSLSSLPAANQFLTKNSSGQLIWGTPAVTAGTSGTMSLPNVGTAGTYVKVVTDAQGRVTQGLSLAAADITGALGQSLTTAVVAESGTNLYYTDARARGVISANAPLSYGISSGQISLAQASGSSNGYLSSSDWTNFTAKQNALGFTPLNKAGDSMSGALNMGGNDVANAGNISMATAKTLMLSNNNSDPTGLTAADKGKTWFNASTNQIKYWDGSSAQALGVSGAGLTNLNGLTGNTQTFASGTSGTSPAISSSGTVHTLNIPLAAATGVTAGLISNSDFASFSGKLAGVAAGTGVSVSTSSGTATISLSSVGTAGTYAKVTTNAQGQVVAGDSLSAGDIPSLDAGKITTGQLSLANGGTGINSTATFPTSGVVVTRDANEALTNKTLNGAVISGASSIAGSTTINTTGTAATGALTAASITSQGNVIIQGNSTTANKLVLNDKGSTKSISLKAPDTLTTSYTWELPDSVGTSGQVLTTNGAGTLSWTSSVSPTGAASGDLTGNYPGPSLASVGTAGTYTKVTTDGKGRVISGGNLSASDLPSHSALLINAGTLGVPNGGTGVTGFTNNGVVIGSSSALSSTAAGAQYNVFVAGSGGQPGFGQVNLASSAAISGVLPVANGGLGISSTPTSGQILVGNGTGYSLASVSPGATQGVSVVASGSGIVLDTAQDIRTSAAPNFAGLTVSGVAASSLLKSNASKALSAATSSDITTTLGYTPLNRAGDSMTGALNMGVSDITNSGNISMSASKTLLLSNNTSDPSGLTAGDKGKTWFNTATNQIKYWDGTTAQALGVSGAGLTNLNGLTVSTQTFATGTSGISPAFSSSGSVHTLNIPLASVAGVTAGALSNSDYASFSSKLGSVAAGTGVAVSTASGTATVSLNSVGTAGTYMKVQTNAQGQVISGSSLSSSDIPSLDASKITTGLLSVANGGTGIGSFNLNGVLIGNGTGNLVSTTTPSADQILRVPSAGGQPSFGAIDLSKSASVGGILPGANGGTGVNSTATFPTSGVVVTRDATETLTNKTLSAATINGASSIGGSTTINTTGTAATGALTAASVSSQGNVTILGNSTTANKLVLNDKGSTNSVALKAPDTLASSLTWELPSTNGSSGQVLSTNGSGTLSWVSAAVGSVTNVTGTAPISVATGTSTPVISMSQANGTTNGYLSSADWTTFNNKQAAGNYITALTGDVTATGPGSTAATLAAVAIGGTSTKVTYDVKGRVTSGTSLIAADIPPLSAAIITSGTLAAANGGTGVYSTATFPTTGVVVTEAATETLTNKTLSAATINGASNISGSTTISTTGTAATGALTAASVSSQGNVTILGNGTTANKLVLNDKGSTNSVALKAPDTLSSSLTWELPSTNGTSGQVLSTNGSGTLSWVSAAVGSVTNVTGTAPISVATGSSTPVISMSQANGTTNGYLSSADWTTFNSKQAAGSYITALTGDVTASGAGSAAASLSTTGVTAGTYTKVTVDAKGRAIAGTSLVAADIPAHSAALISSGTLAVANGGTGVSSTTSNSVFAGPTSGSGAPSFRSLVAGDLPAMGGANGTAAGTAGAVPGPAATDNVKFLRGDGIWATPTAAAAGAANQIQYNSGSGLAGNANFVYSGGNVGIGTTAPVAALDVTGGLRVTGAGGSTATSMAYFGSGTAATAGNIYGLTIDKSGYDSLLLGVNKNTATGSVPANSSFVSSYSASTGLSLGRGNNTGVPSTSDLYINGSGNVGIGTTAPTSLLHTADTAAKTTTYTGVLHSVTNTSSTAGVKKVGMDIESTGTWNGDGAVNTGLVVNATGGFTNYAAVFTGGNVGIGTTSPAATLDVQGSSQWPLRLRNTGSSAGNYWSIGPDASNNLVIYNQTPLGVYITTGASSWSANSDYRVKKNFLPISDALEKTLQLRGLTYHYKTDADTDPRRVGVIAQDVQRVLPEAVAERDGILSVRYTEIIPLLIEAIKEMKHGADLRFASIMKLWADKDAEIEELKARVGRAEAESSALKARADRVEADAAQLKAFLCSQSPNAPMCPP